MEKVSRAEWPGARIRASVDSQPGEFVPKADGAAQGNQLPPDIPHHLPEDVGADVGPVRVLHVGGSPRFHQGVQHGGDAGVVGAGGQLAVGEGPRPSLAELDVGALVQRPGGPEVPHVQGAPVNVLPPLQNGAGQAAAGQEQRGEQPRRPHPHYHRGERGFPFHLREHVGGSLRQGDVPPRRASHHSPLVGHGGFHCVDIVDAVFFSGVDGLPDDLQLPQRPRPHPQRLSRPPAQQVHIPADGQG